MKLTKLKLAAGSLTAAVLVALLTPMNMGGCSDATQALTGAVNTVGGGSVPGVGAIGHGSGGVDLGSAIQGGVQVWHGASVTNEDERAMGQCVALSVSQRYPPVQDDALNRYVSMVAQTVADSSPSGGKPVVFVVNTDEMNAYSGPTGYIMITRGLLRRLEDESELAGVLGHEVGHVVERHGLDAVKTGETWNGFVKLGTSFAGRYTAVANVGGSISSFVLGSAYNQGQENQADQDSVVFITAAGYDPQGFVRALQRIRAAGGAQAQGGFGKSHPGIADRIAAVQREIDAQSVKTGQINRDRFLAATRGIR